MEFSSRARIYLGKRRSNATKVFASLFGHIKLNHEDVIPLTDGSCSNLKLLSSSSQPRKTHKRRKTKRPTEISQSSGPTTLIADETVYVKRGDSMERAATTAACLDAEQDNGNIIRTQSMETLIELSSGTGVNIPGSGEDRLKIMELMEIYTKLSNRVLALENVKIA
ncbi:hypothetical protein Tco_1314039 [Tanacetum coccineum]